MTDRSITKSLDFTREKVATTGRHLNTKELAVKTIRLGGRGISLVGVLAIVVKTEGLGCCS